MVILMFQRQLTSKLKDLVQSFPVILLTGPRQSGKTTLVKGLFPNFQYVLLEAPDRLLEVRSDPRGFLEQDVAGWIFDEAQRYPELFMYLQEYVDGGSRKPIILTGSQNFLLSEKISQSLAGRAAVLELLSLSLAELKSAPRLQTIPLFEFLFRGTYPRPYHEGIPVNDWYNAYIQTYLERDVRQISQIGDLLQFQLFLKLCAGRVGQILNLESLGADCGVSQPTAKRWLSILESSRIIFRLPPHHKNFKKRLVRRPKLYFYDTSLICGLLDIADVSQLRTHSMRGAIFENHVIAETAKFYFHRGKRPPIYFWRDHRGLEIDLVLDLSGHLFCLELKSSSTLGSDFTAALLQWRKIAEIPSFNHLGVVYGGDEKRFLNSITIYPWSDVFAICERFEDLKLSS